MEHFDDRSYERHVRRLPNVIDGVIPKQLLHACASIAIDAHGQFHFGLMGFA